MCISSWVHFIATVLAVGVGIKVYTSYFGTVPDVNKGANVVIIGSGFGGICAGIKLGQLGIPYTIIEKASALGGTWRENTYPGAACDIQAALYSFSFELNPNFTKVFAPQEEILAYLNHCA